MLCSPYELSQTTSPCNWDRGDRKAKTAYSSFSFFNMVVPHDRDKLSCHPAKRISSRQRLDYLGEFGFAPGLARTAGNGVSGYQVFSVHIAQAAGGGRECA
jgi:hypothetical protein